MDIQNKAIFLSKYRVSKTFQSFIEASKSKMKGTNFKFVAVKNKGENKKEYEDIIFSKSLSVSIKKS